jgi:hypothetical protein
MNQKSILNFVIDEIYQLESYVQGWRDVEDVPVIYLALTFPHTYQ